MISGKIVDGRVVLPVNFCLTEIADLTIEFVVDTGFNGYLTLPPQAIAVMNLPLESTLVATLADGSESEMPIHLAKIRWDDLEEVVTVLATGTKPLLGTALLQGFRLIVEFADEGMVKVEPLVCPGDRV
jgi:clan AA aspartic protease